MCLHITHISTTVKKRFCPQSNINHQSNPTILYSVKFFSTTIKDRMLDKKRSIYYSLSVSGNKHSFKRSLKQDRIDFLHVHATSNIAESLLGGTTRVLKVGSAFDRYQAAIYYASKQSGYMNHIEL